MSNDHVNSGRFDELSDLNFLDATKVGDELEIQIAGRLAGFALTDRFSINDHGLALEIRKHFQALIGELFILQRFILSVEQNGINLYLSQSEPVFV